MVIAEPRATSPYAGRRMSLDEFLKLPGQEPDLEWEDGMVSQKASPRPAHGRGQLVLMRALGHAGEDTGLGQVFIGTRFTLPDWAPIPDAAFYLQDTLDALLDDGCDYFGVPPDIAVEVTSPDESIFVPMPKCLRYVRSGARVAVLLVVEERSVLVFRPDQPPVVAQGAEAIDLSDVLPAFDLTVDGLFTRMFPRRPTPQVTR